MFRAWQAAGRATCRRSPRRCCYFRSTVDHVVDALSEPLIIRHRCPRATCEVRSLEDSYHVATLDNDAERIFAESAEFVARVTAP